MVYLGISNKFVDKSIIEINDIIYGKYLGKVISINYILYTWFVILGNTRFVADFFNTYLFPETDTTIFILLIIGGVVYTVRKGIEGIYRIYSWNKCFCMHSFRRNNIFPDDISPCKRKKYFKKSSYLGFILGGVYFLILVARNTLVIGNIEAIHVNQTYQVARMVVIGDTITRSEILVAIILFFTMFIRICIFFCSTSLALSQIFKLNSCNILTFPVGIISGILSISMYSSQTIEGYSATNIFPVFVIPTVVIIPVITLIMIRITNKSVKMNNNTK